MCFDKKENPNFTTLEFVVSVLAIGDGTYNLTRFLNQLNDYVESKKLPELFSFFENLLKIFFHLLILMFILFVKDSYKCEEVNERKKMLKHKLKLFFIALLTSTCLNQWIFVIAQESHHESSLAHNQSKNDTKIKNYSNFELILFPLAIEFRICCAVELAIIFSRIYYKKKEKVRPTEISHDSGNKKQSGPCLIFLAFFILLILFSFIMFQFNNAFEDYFSELVINTSSTDTIKSITNIIHNDVEKYSVIFSEIIQSILSIICILLYCKCKCKRPIDGESIRLITNGDPDKGENLITNVDPDKDENLITNGENVCQKIRNYFEKPENIDLFCLFFVFAAIVAYFVIQIAGFSMFFKDECKSNLLKDEDALIKTMLAFTMSAELLSPIASVIQIFKIWKLVKKQEKNIELPLILINLSIWIFDTFSAKDSRTNPFMIRGWGEPWHNIDPILIPLTIFFNFHATVILIKLKTDHYHH